MLIYAISNNKKHFLQLIDEHSNEFLAIDSDSLLFNENFYSKYINLNTLTSKNLQTISSIKDSNTKIDYLENNIYTFEEIKLLCNVPKSYILLYNHLLDLKIDSRLLIMQQLLKKNLLHDRDMSDKEIEKLAEKLKIKPLYRWFETDFANIKGLKVGNIIDIFINYDIIKRFIPQISAENELLYIIRNIEQIQHYKDLNEIKENLENTDLAWKELVYCMKFSQDFIRDNKESIESFLLNNESELALTYFRNCETKQKESFKRIVKAKLMGEFKKLKYYSDDLKKEIDFDLKDYQIQEWTTNNMTIEEDGIEVSEYDDFYNTMILGVSPQRTCLSYKDGMYCNCLLACFDSNKKILYAQIGGKTVARAMIRLTKGTYHNLKKISYEEFSFVDLENLQDSKDTETKKDINNQEYLTIFLEKSYIANVSLSQEKKIKKMFIKLLEKKALQMNANLVLSKYYNDIANDNYISTKYHMYISNSKAGSQYLDSLGGQATVMNEGQYKENTFLIWQNENHSLLEDGFSKNKEEKCKVLLLI